MHIRCQCGQNLGISTNAQGAILRDLEWYDAETGEVRCPKCKNNVLPVAAAGPLENGIVPLRLQLTEPVDRARKQQ